MKKYDYVVDIASPLDFSDLVDINNRFDGRILLRLQNTIGLTSSMLLYLDTTSDIRVEGGYDKERVEHYKYIRFKSGEAGSYYYDSVIYSRNELINILKEIEKIESGIESDFSDLDKVVYIYHKLKSDIMYDPKYVSEPSKKTRSLRGLLTKQTVCAGYAMIFKELMDRNNIKCDYVEGSTEISDAGLRHSAHAWNIVELNGKKYGVDLTFDNSRYRNGNFDSFKYLCPASEEFSECHIPYSFEKIKDYKSDLDKIDIDKIMESYMKLFMSKIHTANIYSIKKEDGNLSLVCHVGTEKIKDKKYHKYFFIEDIYSNTPPIIVFTEFNLTDFMYSKINEGKKYTLEECIKVASKLFSKQNILDSLKKRTLYIGNIFSNSEEVIKETSDVINFRKNIKIIKREDGSYFIIEFISKSEEYYKYNICELVRENEKLFLEENMIYSSSDLNEYTDLLTRDNIQRIVKENNRLFEESFLINLAQNKL